ncbi:MAG: DUF1844 domain-containing protein [Endomicrobiia bacterium]|nr:DUF1844 domain-containing protein [Endomicrobiia bacterium]
MPDKKPNPHFVNIVLMLASACWQQLGKVPNPLNEKIERQIDHAKLTIDMLIMLKEKTAGNLAEEEEKILLTTLADLELNYADEAKKESSSDGDETKH